MLNRAYANEQTCLPCTCIHYRNVYAVDNKPTDEGNMRTTVNTVFIYYHCDKNCLMHELMDKEQQPLTEEGSAPMLKCLKHFDYIV